MTSLQPKPTFNCEVTVFSFGPKSKSAKDRTWPSAANGKGGKDTSVIRMETEERTSVDEDPTEGEGGNPRRDSDEWGRCVCGVASTRKRPDDQDEGKGNFKEAALRPLEPWHKEP